MLTDIGLFPVVVVWSRKISGHCVKLGHDIGLARTFFSPNGSAAPWGPRTPHFSRRHDHTF
jgi:hypothetical protein